MQLGNRDLVGTDPFADLAVIAIFEPLGGNRFLPAPKALGVGSGQLGPRKQTGGLEYRAEGGADGTFDAVVDIRFHHFYYRTTDSAENTEGKLFSKEKNMEIDF
jgi:hypothetical protein